jgi:ribonuclease Z
MTITFLGTNGWYDTDTGNTICTLIDAKAFYLVLDAGNGIHKLDKYIKQDKPIYLFISHLHIDHIVGLHVLDKFNFIQELNIFIPAGTKDDLMRFCNHPFTSGFDHKKFKITVTELGEGEHQDPLKLVCKKLQHIDNDFGYRFEIENKIMTYCCDTAVCDNDFELAKNADLLIHECALAIGGNDLGWGHSSPVEAAELAKRAKVKKLILTHLTPTVYSNFAKRRKAESEAKKIFPEITAAKDEMQITL